MVTRTRRVFFCQRDSDKNNHLVSPRTVYLKTILLAERIRTKSGKSFSPSLVYQYRHGLHMISQGPHPDSLAASPPTPSGHKAEDVRRIWRRIPEDFGDPVVHGGHDALQEIDFRSGKSPGIANDEAWELDHLSRRWSNTNFCSTNKQQNKAIEQRCQSWCKEPNI